MSKRIYVGNLNYTTNEEKITSLFSAYGEVTSATIIYDNDTQQSKGFGFVEMTDDGAALRAISELSGKEVDGRKIRVNEAEERRERTVRHDRPAGGYRSNRRDFGERRGGRDFRDGNRSGRNDRGGFRSHSENSNEY